VLDRGEAASTGRTAAAEFVGERERGYGERNEEQVGVWGLGVGDGKPARIDGEQ